MVRRKRGAGRPRKFKLGEIILDANDYKVVVEHRLRGTKSEYRVIPLNGASKRFGPAAWRSSGLLTRTGRVSATGSILTYRANEWLDRELPEGRGCACQCCVHSAIPRNVFKVSTGEMMDDD